MALRRRALMECYGVGCYRNDRWRGFIKTELIVSAGYAVTGTENPHANIG